MENLDELVYDYVRLIPLGMVTTFAELARAVGNNFKTTNVVSALKRILDVIYIPSYRVVSSDGELSSSFIDGGKRGQKRYLKNEGVVVKKNRVDLSKYCFYFW